MEPSLYNTEVTLGSLDIVMKRGVQKNWRRATCVSIKVKGYRIDSGCCMLDSAGREHVGG